MNHPLKSIFLYITIGLLTLTLQANAEKTFNLTTGDALKSHWVEKNAKDNWVTAKDVTQHPENEKKLKYTSGQGIIINGTNGRTRNLISKAHFGDVKASIEFMVPKGSNSGVYFMGQYEVQILDSYGKKKVGFGDCGGIYQRWDGARGKRNEGFEGTNPRLNASKAPGEWQKFEVIFRAPRFNDDGIKIAHAKFVSVKLNGKTIHENIEVTGTTRSGMGGQEKAFGPIMLQGDHGPVAYRNIIITPVNLDRKKPKLYGKRTIQGWTEQLKHANRDKRIMAAEALANAGPAGMPMLIQLLKHKEATLRHWACYGIAQADRQTRERITQLPAMMKDNAWDVRMIAGYALRYTKHHDAAIDTLIKSMYVKNPALIAETANYLGDIGPRANKAIPALKALSERSHPGIKSSALQAIKRIQR